MHVTCYVTSHSVYIERPADVAHSLVDAHDNEVVHSPLRVGRPGSRQTSQQRRCTGEETTGKTSGKLIFLITDLFR